MGKILVMDDKKSIRDLFLEYSSYLGHTINTVETGEEAIDLISKNHYDLAFFDLQNYVGKGGVETMGEVKKIAPGLPVVLMTTVAASKAKAVQRPQDYGFVGLLAKPFNLVAIKDIAFLCLLRFTIKAISKIAITNSAK